MTQYKIFHPHSLIGLKEVIQMTSLSRSTILRLVDKNEFPRPSLVSGRNLWLFETVERWNLDQVGNGAGKIELTDEEV